MSQLPIYKSEEFNKVVIGLLSDAADAGGIPANLPKDQDAEAIANIVRQIAAAKGNFGLILTALLGGAGVVYGVVQKIEGEINPPVPVPPTPTKKA